MTRLAFQLFIASALILCGQNTVNGQTSGTCPEFSSSPLSDFFATITNSQPCFYTAASSSKNKESAHLKTSVGQFEEENKEVASRRFFPKISSGNFHFIDAVLCCFDQHIKKQITACTHNFDFLLEETNTRLQVFRI